MMKGILKPEYLTYVSAILALLIGVGSLDQGLSLTHPMAGAPLVAAGFLICLPRWMKRH